MILTQMRDTILAPAAAGKNQRSEGVVAVGASKVVPSLGHLPVRYRCLQRLTSTGMRKRTRLTSNITHVQDLKHGPALVPEWGPVRSLGLAMYHGLVLSLVFEFVKSLVLVVSREPEPVKSLAPAYVKSLALAYVKNLALAYVKSPVLAYVRSLVPVYVRNPVLAYVRSLDHACVKSLGPVVNPELNLGSLMTVDVLPYGYLI